MGSGLPVSRKDSPVSGGAGFSAPKTPVERAPETVASVAKKSLRDVFGAEELGINFEWGAAGAG
jgi:hypothetical protein